MNVNLNARLHKYAPTVIFFVIITIVAVTATLQVKSIDISAHEYVSKVILPKSSSVVPEFDINKHSLTDTSSLWVIANKSNQLNPADYIPPNLVNIYGGIVSERMVYDLKYMFDAASKDGIGLTIASSYRSYNTQQYLFNRYSASNGQAVADTFSARPGYSEHQTGLSIDFGSVSAPACNINECYAETTAGEWLANHAMDYGFILRYPENKQLITGYVFEPWHYRYVGHNLADEMKKQSITTLEEFFNIPGGTTY